MRFHPTLVATTYDSPLGRILLAATPTALAGLWFEGQKHHPDAPAGASTGSARTGVGVTDGWRRDPTHPILVEAVRQLDDYFAGRRTCFDLPLDLQGGTPFQQGVWRALLAIPCGQRTSYAALSATVGAPAAVRAVGAAVGRNPVSIVVPCHRVVGSDGSLTGYAGGIERKTALLRIEATA